MKKYKLDEVFSELSDGYNTNVGINGGNLSLGMQKLTVSLSKTQSTFLVLNQLMVRW